jgi:hypothetical protein
MGMTTYGAMCVAAAFLLFVNRMSAFAAMGKSLRD